MTSDVATDARPEAETPVVLAQPLQLSVHVAFEHLPVAAYPDDSADKGAMKFAPPFLRFPVNLSAEDATVLQNIFDSARVALVGFEIKNTDGSPRYYRAVLASQ